MKILALIVIFSFPIHANEYIEIDIARQKCQFKSVISSTTQQTRIDYFKMHGKYQSWETFLHYVAEEMGLANDKGLTRALEISKEVFFKYRTETKADIVSVAEFDQCWRKFVLMNAGSEV